MPGLERLAVAGALALDFLAQEVEQTRDATLRAQLDGDEIVYLDKIGGRRPISVNSRIGGRKPEVSMRNNAQKHHTLLQFNIGECKLFYTGYLTFLNHR